MSNVYFFIKRLFCRHVWNRWLIFSAPPNTHTIVKQCFKCKKDRIVSTMTRQQWRNGLKGEK